ncbi:toxin co-regulated pilus biosynthesis Q family protein [Massilia aerilata]|uniref:Toxin co-regulated pilus biosynthesis Q family protein n=1 Tax=Massilia aerilata TaxID=453817 RepID=A0ABW0S143_9BURK
MKLLPFAAILTLAVAMCFSASAAQADRSYYVTELAAQQKFDVYNDGHNTYLESIPGLVVTGATAEGERFIVNGVPQQIRGFMNGKPITVVRGVPPAPKPALVPKAEPATVSSELKRLKDELAELTSKVPARVATPTPTTTAANGPASKKATGALSASHVPPAAAEKAKYITASDVMVYQVTPGQHDLRTVIDSWAKVVGWSAVWDMDRDIPINMADAKENDFRSAVRRLLAATEFGDLPAKPCFYSNNVIRVVRKTTKCNPNE